MPEFTKPWEIEKRSFEIIRAELNGLGEKIDPRYEQVILRAIHTTADFEYSRILMFSDGVIEYAASALRSGACIISDTNMVKAGIDESRLKKFGGTVNCFIKDSDVCINAEQKGITRSKAAVDKAAVYGGAAIMVVGNAPTALIRICELKEEGKYSPKLVIGVPVGFVNVIEAKERLIGSGIPYITTLGRKGGSTVAAAICNALLRMAACG